MNIRETVPIEVEWDTDTNDTPPPTKIDLPIDIYYDGMTSWDDPVTEWLSNNYGFLVRNWKYRVINTQDPRRS